MEMFPEFYEMQRNLRKTWKGDQEAYRSRERQYQGPEKSSLIMEGVNLHCLNNFLGDDNQRGKGVGLHPLWSREEEQVPGDVILTVRGQLSQYRPREKISHRKTENAKPCAAIFSLEWHNCQKFMENLQFYFTCPLSPPLQLLCFYNNSLSCALAHCKLATQETAP